MSSLEVVDVLLLLLLLYCLLHCVSMLSGNGLIINGEIIRERERDRFPMCVCVFAPLPLSMWHNLQAKALKHCVFNAWV